ncbi:MAG: nuclease-related domain-containing protein [Cyanobacteria bacterium P01_C01_bin.120]
MTFLKKRQRRHKRQSPLKDNPLRNPGQSLDEEINRIIGEEGDIWIATFCFCIALTLCEWWRWYANAQLNPVAMTIAATPFLVLSSLMFLRTRHRVKRLRMARDGEKAVGQFLADLQAKGYRVFHDILGDGFNIDHIVISDRGIFTIETKTYSKPIKGRSEIQFDGEKLLINGHLPYRDPVTQAKAQAHWTRQILKESTGKDYPVKAAIVFPGWFVRSTVKGKRNPVWALNPKALPSFIDNEPQVLRTEDVQLAAYHLSRYIRMKR